MSDQAIKDLFYRQNKTDQRVTALEISSNEREKHLAETLDFIRDSIKNSDSKISLMIQKFSELELALQKNKSSILKEARDHSFKLVGIALGIPGIILVALKIVEGFMK